MIGLRSGPAAGAGAAVLALLAALTGCGVPSGSSVVVEGRGQLTQPEFGNDSTNEPDGRAATAMPETFMENYLAAAAGEPKEAVRRVREFFVPSIRGDWTPPPEVQIIRLRGKLIIDPSPSGYEVQAEATVLGELGENGIFEPAPAKDVKYRFVILGSVEGQTGLFVSEAPPVVLLSDTALQRYFELRTIYFWSTDHRVLVPDLRYLPRRDVSDAQRPTVIIDWLLRGPSPWLNKAVEALPQDARAVGKVPARPDGVLKVALTKAVDTEDPQAVERLATQLRWSLRTSTADPKLELGLDQVQRSFDDSGYLLVNPAYRGGRDPVRFCVVRGEVRQLAPAPTQSPPVPAVPAKSNRQVERAALASAGGRMAVALVRTMPGGRRVLEVGGGDRSVPALERVALPSGSIGQPVWVPGDPTTGMITVGGRLFVFRSTGVAPRPVDDSPTEITAFAIAPDARRMAYVRKGRLYIVSLPRAGNAITVGESQQVPTTLSELSAVGWSQQDWLLIAGRQPDGLVTLVDITVDGAAQAAPRGGSYGTQPVVHLVASPDDPVNGRGGGQAMYVVNGLAYDLFSQSRQLKQEDILGPVPSAGAGAGAADPTFPFFLAD